MAEKILLINGPNLNLLGKREPEIYGETTLDEINSELEKLGTRLGIFVETFQSNHEGIIIEKIQEAAATHDQPWRRRNPHCLRRHQERLRP